MVVLYNYVMANNEKSNEHWKTLLSDESYQVTRESATERPFTGKYWNFDEGRSHITVYVAILHYVKSDTKFDAGCGWPSFFVASAMMTQSDEVSKDTSHGMSARELRSGVQIVMLISGMFLMMVQNPTGLRYCINSVSIDFKDKKE